MKKFYIIVSLIFFVVISVISLAKATQPVLKGSVMAVPNEMYGLWRVVSKRIDTDSPITFKEKVLAPIFAFFIGLAFLPRVLQH